MSDMSEEGIAEDEVQVARASRLGQERYNLSAVISVVRNVREEGVKPRVHPNGFIQLDLVPDPSSQVALYRLHVWPDGLEGVVSRQVVRTVIHDHKFMMESRVLRGALLQTTYCVELDGVVTHEVYLADYQGVESTLRGTGVEVHVKRAGEVMVRPQETYRQRPRTFHTTDWFGLTATLMFKSSEMTNHVPRILVPLGSKPDNGYRRSNDDENVLWRYIDKALAS